MKVDPVTNHRILQSIFDSLPYSLYVLNDKLEVQWVNQKAAEASKSSGASRRGKKYCYKEILHKRKPCDDCPARRTLKSGRIESAEMRSECAEGHRHLLVTSVPLGERLSDNTPLMVEMVQDITASKDVEEQLRRVGDLNSAIIENAPVAVFTINKNGEFLSVNPALGAISGLGAEAPAKLLKFNWLKNAFTIRCGLADYIKRGLNGEAFELWDFPFISYRGNSQYLHFRGVPLKAKDGNVEGLLCIIEETTERVRISAQLMQEGKMSAIGRLATAIAHELNNPLATLVAHSELACDLMQPVEGKKIGDGDLEELRGYMEVVQKQAFRCKEIIKDLFNLLWREGSEEGLADVNSLLDEIIERKDFEGQGVRLTKDFRPNLPNVKGDSNALWQVFTNIIQNAIDAIEERPGQIWIRTDLADNCVTVEIEDNGVGIPDPIAAHIFEPFFTTKKSNKGMGLGLTICYDLMKKMGGSIKMQQRQWGGSIFRISLPVRKSED